MQINNTLSIDDNSRIKILNEINKNFFVVANAGSGKTSILVNRMVAMIESGIDISKICAITFTKAAATEFLDRFQKTLRERENTPDTYKAKYKGDLGPSSDEKRNYCKNALKNINQCFLGTIDAFCNQVLSEYPLDAKIPSSSAVIDEDEEVKAYLKEYTEISKDETSEIYKSFLNFNTVNKNAQNVFSNSIGDIICASSLNIQFDVPKKSLLAEFEKIKITYEKDIIRDIEELSKCKGYVTDEQKYLDYYAEFDKQVGYFKNEWTEENFIDLIIDIYKKVKNLRFTEEPSTKIIKFSPMKSGKAFVYDGDINSLTDLYNDILNIRYNYSLEFLLKVADIVRKKLKKEGKLTFNEYLLTFREMLINDMNNGMNIIKHIRGKHSYFLIDESQDTSPFQTELFLYLTSSIKALKKEECKPIPGSLFILGDPKQSIYRFRGADVPSYLNTKALFENVFDKNENEVLIMTKNFRSTTLLINYFNDAFKNMDNYYQIPVESNIKGTTGLYLYNNYVDVIKEMLNNDDYQVEAKDGDNKVLRAPLYKDFMIITKGKDKHDEIIQTLKENNIPCYVEGCFSISGTDIIKSVYAIYNYVANKDNNTNALYDLLVSPIFGLSSEQIIGKKKEDLPDDIINELNKLEELSNIDSPIILYDQILTNIELFKKVDFSNMEYAYYVLEALKDAYNNTLISSFDDALVFIENFVLSKQERVMSMDFKPNAVKIANLHKVKGLEAPIVILIKAGTGSKAPTIRNDYIENKSYIMQTGEFTYKSGSKDYAIKTNIFQNESILEKEEQKLENERLKYVAATRARSYLLIDNSSRNSFWSSLVTDDFKEFNITSPKDINPNKIKIEDACDSIDINFNNESTYEIKSPSKLELEKVKSKYSDPDLDNYKNIDSRLKGTVIHRLMELIVSSKFSMKKEELINNIKSEFETYNINDDYLDILNNVYDIMTNGGYEQENNREKDILSILKRAKCYCEIPFSYKDGNEIWYGNIDLLYELDGKWFIVDYKTNFENKNLDKEYEKQLNAYKKALKTIKNIDAEAYIYHIG